jgi:tetrahydromethanopterin S-methyltransferase subunit H
MSERARDFVESWKEEQLQPAANTEEALAQSAALAEACYQAAAEAGISKKEIDQEYEDLASDIAAALEAQIGAKTKGLAQAGD